MTIYQMTINMILPLCVCLVAQSCPTLCDPMDCSPPSSSVHGDSPGKNTGVDCQALLQGIFLPQESNQGLLHCRRILYQLSYPGSPELTINVPKQMNWFKMLKKKKNQITRKKNQTGLGFFLCNRKYIYNWYFINTVYTVIFICLVFLLQRRNPRPTWFLKNLFYWSIVDLQCCVNFNG